MLTEKNRECMQKERGENREAGERRKIQKPLNSPNAQTSLRSDPKH